jgi:hypothetical protein
VSLDPDLCITGEDSFTDINSEVSIFEFGPVYPRFEFLQDGSLLTVLVDYVPDTNMSIVTVNLVASVSENCSFSVSHTGTIRGSINQCNYPLSIAVNRSEPPHPALVKGGDLIKLRLSLTALSATAQNLFFSLSDIHPALALVDHEFANVANTDRMDSGVLGEAERLEVGESLFANLTFRVLPYVQPGANLYLSFIVSYQVPASFGSTAFVQGFKFFDEYTSNEVVHGNWSFKLPYYDGIDHVDFTFPPHVDDIFFVDIPITVPCVSTELNATIVFPVFLSDNFTMFLTNITDVTIALPDNMIRVAQLCRYHVAEFDRSMCETQNLELAPLPYNITTATVNGPGVDTIYINLGPVTYNHTSFEECVTNSSVDNCTCEQEDVVITVEGHVADDYILCQNITHMFDKLLLSPCGIFCENQTLADNVTLEYSYVGEVTTETDPMQLDTNPSITRSTVDEDGYFPVNASMPAISVPINSFSGDAGDSYNLTFGVLHNSEYSSFTAYDLNYTFTVDPHLDPEQNITICFFNASMEPLPCEEIPFINLTISRFGFHPE